MGQKGLLCSRSRVIYKAVVVLLVGIVGLLFQATRLPPPQNTGASVGSSVSSPRIRLRDGRFLAYRERSEQEWFHLQDHCFPWFWKLQGHECSGHSGLNSDPPVALRTVALRTVLLLNWIIVLIWGLGHRVSPYLYNSMILLTLDLNPYTFTYEFYGDIVLTYLFNIFPTKWCEGLCLNFQNDIVS